MKKFKRSLLPPALRGVTLFYTGQAGAGKTTGALLDPNNTFFIDADHMKGYEMSKAKPKMVYRAVNSDDKNDPAKTGELFLKAVDEINKDKITVVVIDNLYEVQEGLHAYAVKNPVEVAKLTNKVASNITGRKWGQDTLAHERLLKAAIDELLAAKVTVIIIAHMKEKFGVIGQLEIRGRQWVYEAASFVGIMIRTGAAPDTLVFKSSFNYHVEIDPYELNDEQLKKYQLGELESCQVFPRIPRRIPAFTPSKLFRYLARTSEQISSTPYSQDEILDEEEMAPYREILTKQQRMDVSKLMELEEKERERAIAFEDNLKEVERVNMDKFIVDNPDMGMPELINTLKTRFQMFASEVSPVYIMQVRSN